MNKKTIFTIFLFFILYFTYSQNYDKGLATYSVEYLGLDVKTDKKAKNELETMSNSYFKNNEERKRKLAEFILYKLEFNGSNSVFYMKGILDVENKRASRFFNVGKIYIFGNEKIRERISYGSKFLISSKVSDIKWTILKEQKKIGKFNCFKASAIKTVVNSKGIFYRKITAWYCPNINLLIGPKGYGNLPGLILELRIEHEGIYTLKELKLKPKKEIKIKKPLKGNKVTEDEFVKIGIEVFKNRHNRKGMQN